MRLLRTIFVLVSIMLFSNSVLAACPRLFSVEFPTGSNTSPVVKRMNTNSTGNNTIFFCKEPRPAFHTEVSFSANELIGNAAGVERIATGNASSAIPMGTGSVTMSGGNAINPYILEQLNTRILATQPRTWGEPTLFHFYSRIRRNRSCSWNIHRRIRDYLRSNPDVFRAGTGGAFNQLATAETANSWDIAKITDVNLRNANNKLLKADLLFYWYQNRARGGGQGTGGNWITGNRRICHFAVAVEMQVKTNIEGATYDIDESGDYDVDVGVWTQN